MKRIILVFFLACCLLSGVFGLIYASTNYVQNPTFNYTFDDWNVTGCWNLVHYPKESAAKQGPSQWAGICDIGEDGTMTQTLPITTGTTTRVISFTMRYLIKGNGNQIIATLSDGNGWEWEAFNETAITTVYDFSPVVTTTLPLSLTQLELEIYGLYGGGPGTKVRDVTAEVSP